jgi:hypothetical protein
MSDWEAINAYVDGMLSPEEAAETAERISRDPALARQAAALSRMKVSVAAAFETETFKPDFTGMPESPAPEQQAPPGWRRGLAVAAVLIFIAAAVIFLSPDETGTPNWLTAAYKQHEAISAQDTLATNQRFFNVAALSGFRPFIPDLTAAKLHLFAMAPFHMDDPAGSKETGIILNFRGTRGCRLSYVSFMLPDIDKRIDEALYPFKVANANGYSWRVGDIGYLLIATGMDIERLAVLSEAVHSASRKHQPFDDVARTRLAQSRAESRACAT